MKNLKYITATAVIVCLAVFLFACGGGADGASTTQEPIVSPSWSEAQVFTLPSEAPTGGENEKQADAEQADEVLRRIETARAVYGLFLESRPQLDKKDSITVQEGLSAYRVTDPKLDTWEKLQAYVSGYFSEEITQKLLNIGMFVQSGEKLYALDVGMQPPPTGKLQVEVTEKTDASEHYRLTVTTDTEKTYEYDYAKQKDGKWVFTHFEAY